MSCCTILSTRLLALQCRKMCVLPLQQDFYSKSRHASPQNSSQLYAYGLVHVLTCGLWRDRSSGRMIVCEEHSGHTQHTSGSNSILQVTVLVGLMHSMDWIIDAELLKFARRTDCIVNGDFLPRCMECRRGIAMRILSVCLSVCLSHAWIVTKRKKDLSRFIYHTKEHLA